ncbi:hypothetical protein JCM10207_002097 [Rhodosporidiobolus poonsookiae]
MSATNVAATQGGVTQPTLMRGGFSTFYRHPFTQISVIAMICFACPGMFNSLSGVGGGGQLDPKTANDGNVALYSVFAVVGFFSGSLVNKIGHRLAFSAGGSTYALYMGSLLSFNMNGNTGFVIAAGAILGFGASLLWTSQSSLTLAYATEGTKGKAFALFAAATFLPLLLVKPESMLRTDGTQVKVPVHPSWKSEFVGMYQLLRKDYWIWSLFPFFVASNWMYTYEQNSFNGALGTLRARSLGSLLFWLAQLVGAGIFGVLIDLQKFRRKSRAWAGLAFLFVLNMVLWGAAYHYQRGYYRTPDGASIPRVDIKDSAYAGIGTLYFFLGLLDAIMQNYVYWLMGAMYNEAGELARLTGIYKGVQSAAAAGAWRMDSVGTSYMTELASTWAVCMAALVFAIPVVAFRIKDHTEDVEGEVQAVRVTTSISSAEEKKAEEV